MTYTTHGLDQVHAEPVEENPNEKYYRPLSLVGHNEMFHNRSHGGYCCGVQHIHGFSRVRFDTCTGKTALKFLEEKTKFLAKESSGNSIEYSMCNLIQVVLRKDQALHWHHKLLGIGYKQVSVFRNRNSHSLCVVYHYYADVSESFTPNG